jgi:molybdopterin-guanine dinucleotide biosynthesis protein A
MGVDKALLRFGNATMIERVVGTVSSVVAPQQVVIAAAAEQEVPSLEATILRDAAEYEGPLAAIARGLEVLSPQVDAVFATGCDTPLLSANVISYLFDELADFDCVVPRDAERLHPLCAVYSSSILSKLRAFNGRSLHGFVAGLNARLVSCDELRSFDPELRSLHNINTPEDYLAALAVAGLSTP